MNKLISMVEFLPEHPYSKFLSQKLKLWMFVPCKLVYGVWVVLEEPYLNYNWASLTKLEKISLIKKYQQSKESILFEGFESKKGYINYTEDWMQIGEEFIEGKTVEDLIPFNLTLTPTAQKMIGL